MQIKQNATCVGIDYSLKSPAVAILYDNEVKYFAFPRENTLKNTYIETMIRAGISVTIVPNVTNVKDLSANERVNSKDAENLATTLCNSIRHYVNADSCIAIEGISFASPGNTKVQYAGFHYILRLIIHKELNIPYENIYIYAPNSVKKTAGKGNYKKHQMIEAFIDSDAPELINNVLKKTLIDVPETFQSPKAKSWVKPLDDIIDAWWTLKTLIDTEKI